MYREEQRQKQQKTFVHYIDLTTNSFINVNLIMVYNSGSKWYIYVLTYRKENQLLSLEPFEYF